ncbi:MAG: hypothetical protein Q8N99_06425 [Nanoarchaeota archaeon]|nr:hypothetical protein [Nanoarchaeota archaeon]
MKYTISKKANEKIEKDMELICEEIKKSIPDTISIILTGGFSRGEGPVKLINKKYYPYNDYDIQVISKTKLSKEDSDRLSIEISKKLGYKGIINFYPFKKEEQKLQENFYIDLKVDTPNDLKKLLPRIRTIELKKYSYILFGEDVRDLIPEYKLEEMPLSEGAKLLLDRMSQMIEYFSKEDKHDKEFLTYIIQQAYAAICTSLLLVSGKYEIGYKNSMLIFKKNYKTDFPELFKVIPSLDKKIEEFIKWKIDPKKLPNKDVVKEWFIARDSILEVSKYFFNNFLKKEINNITDLSKNILEMRKDFYMPYLKEIIKKKSGINFSNISVIFLPILTLIMKYKYYKRLKSLGITYKRLFFNSSPDLIIFASLIYLITGIENNESENIEKSRILLKKVYPVKSENWEDLSLEYANAYIAFFLQKI